MEHGTYQTVQVHFLAHPYKHTYLLTPRSRVLLEKLTGFQSVKKFPTFHGTRRFINAFTSARQLSLSWASSIQSMPSHPTSWRFKSHAPFSLLRSYQSISPGPRRSVWTFRNLIRFYGEKLLAPRPTPKLEDHSVSAVRDCLYNIFAATLHIGGRSSYLQPEDAPCRVYRDPRITATWY